MERREARGTASFSIRGSIYKEEYEVQLQAANNYGFGPKSRIFRGQTGDTAGKLNIKEGQSHYLYLCMLLLYVQYSSYHCYPVANNFPPTCLPVVSAH